MKTKTITILILYFTSYTHLFAQPNIQWQKTIGGSKRENTFFSRQTPDGGFLLNGESNSNISGNKTENSRGLADYWIVKLTSIGTISWQKTIGGSESDVGTAVEETTDGGYFVTGYSFSEISGDKTEARIGLWDWWVLKLDAARNITWQKTIGGSDEDKLYIGTQTTDGGYIVGGSSRSNISGNKTENSRGGYDYWIVKLDASGNISWQKTIGGNTDDVSTNLEQTLDGGYIVVGWSTSGISGDKTETSRGSLDYWIVKLDASGNISWQKTIGGSGDDMYPSVRQTTDGGYIVGGYSNSNISGDKTENSRGGYDYWVVKLDATGTIIWQKTIGGSGDDMLKTTIQTFEGGYLLSGYSDSNISGEKTENSRGNRDYWLVRLYSTGAIAWQKTIGGSSVEEMMNASNVMQTSDGGYFLAGHSNSWISGEKTENPKGLSDYWVIKLVADNLPIELLYFDATLQTNKTVLCQWETATEINNDYFIVERADPSDYLEGAKLKFVPIGTVDGAGNSSVPLNYTFIDNSPFPLGRAGNGLIYYRLKQVDFNGDYSYSHIRAVYWNDFDIIKLSPNPAEDEIKVLLYSNETTNIGTKIYNVLGQKVMEAKQTANKGTTELLMNVEALNTGYYMLEVITESGMYRSQKKLVIR